MRKKLLLYHEYHIEHGSDHDHVAHEVSYLLMIFLFSASIPSSGSGTIPPKRPKCSTGMLHFTASSASSIICPLFNSSKDAYIFCSFSQWLAWEWP